MKIHAHASKNLHTRDQQPRHETMSIEGATVSNMRKIAAVVEVLEREGL